MSTRALTVLFVLQACTLANDIDVCERAAAPDFNLNAIVRGFETGGPGSMTLLPTGGALVFHTSVELEGTTPTTFIRATLVDESGQRQAPCPRLSVLSAPFLFDSDFYTLGYPTAAGPQVAAHSSLGLLTAVRYRTNEDTRVVESRLYGTAFDADGCPLVDGSAARFEIGDEDGSEQIVGPPSVARLGDNRFVVAWVGGSVESASVRTRVKARIVETRPLIAPALGPIVELDRGWVNSVTMTPMDDGRIAFAWQRVVFPAAFRFLEIRSSELEPIEGLEPQLLETLDSATMRADDPRMTLAYDGGQLLAAWTSHEIDQPSRVLVRFRGPSGEPFVGVDSLDGLAFEASDASAGEELNPVAAPLDGGGIVLAWEEHGLRTAPTARIRSAVFDSRGARTFVNPSCGTGPVTLSSRDDRPFREPSLVALGDGILASWTALDRDGGMAEVRARFFSARDLFAVE